MLDNRIDVASEAIFPTLTPGHTEKSMFTTTLGAIIATK